MSVPLLYTEETLPGLHFFEPPDASEKCSLAYLNEGGANFVFGIVLDEDLQSRLHGKLLRLRKDAPHVQSAEEQLTAFDEHFKPLFPSENLVQHELIELHDGVARRINTELKEMHRAPKRRDDLLPTNEPYGMLVTDMTPRNGDILLQLKPKWLAQSPTAPPGAKRCRTCALRAIRATKNASTATDAQGSCPLALISDNVDERERAIQSVTSDNLLHNYLLHDAQPLFQKLRFWQSELDPRGVLELDANASLLDYCKAMTLRDCTLFLKRSGNRVEARFADLDLKQPKRVGTWKTIEEQLLAEGWYTNTEDQAEWTEEEICHLSQ